MSFLHDKNFYLPLIDEYIYKYAQEKNNPAINALAKKLIKNLDDQMNDPVTSSTDAKLGIINLSSLDNFINFIKTNGIKVDNQDLLISENDFNLLKTQSRRNYVHFKEEYINKSAFKQYMERLKTKALKLRSGEDTAQAGQNFQSLISKLITEINQISPDMRLSSQVASEQIKPEQKQKKQISRTTIIDSISNIFYPEQGQIYDGKYKLLYFNINSSYDFNSWIQQNQIKVAISSTLKDKPNFVLLSDEKAKPYLNGFFSSLLERAEKKSESNEDEKNIKQNYIDKLVQVSKEYGINLSSSMQTPTQQQSQQAIQQKQDGYAQQVSYTAGVDLSQIQPNSAQFQQIQESITSIMRSVPLQNDVIHLSNIQNFVRWLNTLQDSNLNNATAQITQFVDEVKSIYNEDTINLNIIWPRNKDGTYSSPFPGLAENRQLCPYLMQMAYVVTSVNNALLTFYNRYNRFFKTDAGNTIKAQQLVYRNNMTQLNRFRITYAGCPS